MKGLLPFDDALQILLCAVEFILWEAKTFSQMERFFKQMFANCIHANGKHQQSFVYAWEKLGR